MKHDQLITTAIGFTIIVAAVAITAWPESTETSNPTEHHRRIVQVAEVDSGSTIDRVRLAGVTRATRRAELAFSLSARLAGRPVEIGDRVVVGQILAMLDDREYRLATQAAGAAAAELDVRLAQARRDLQRVQQLVDARAATTEELERNAAATSALQAARDAAQARLEETRRRLSESVMRSPIAGTVTAVYLEPGEWVSSGRTVVAVAGEGSVEVLVEVPESIHHRVTDDLEVVVEFPFLDIAVGGRVAKVATAVAGPGRLFPIEVTVEPHRALVAGLTADIVFPLQSGDELTIPMRAVINPGSSTPSVYRVIDGQAEEIPVKLGRIRGDRIAVTARLSTRDLIAVSGHTALRDGDTVEVVR